MMLENKEQSLIQHFLKYQKIKRADVVCGSGDDAAVMKISPEFELVTTVDSQIYGTHFDNRFTPYDIGYKSLAVNLSDIAAMGARPTWAMISLSTDVFDVEWMQEFSKGFCDLAAKYNIECVGGNLSKGPLAVHVTLLGQVKQGQLIRQNNILLGDNIVVTGKLGGASWACENRQITAASEVAAFDSWVRPEVPVEFAIEVSQYINAATDISDGLYVDLLRMLKGSNLGAKLFLNNCPYATVLSKLSSQIASDYAWMGGESYQLLFTCSDKGLPKIQDIAKQHNVSLSVVGKAIDAKEIIWEAGGARKTPNIDKSFVHF